MVDFRATKQRERETKLTSAMADRIQAPRNGGDQTEDSAYITWTKAQFKLNQKCSRSCIVPKKSYKNS